jgi:hypothetical protein
MNEFNYAVQFFDAFDLFLVILEDSMKSKRRWNRQFLDSSAKVYDLTDWGKTGAQGFLELCHDLTTAVERQNGAPLERAEFSNDFENEDFETENFNNDSETQISKSKRPGSSWISVLFLNNVSSRVFILLSTRISKLC